MTGGAEPHHTPLKVIDERDGGGAPERRWEVAGSPFMEVKSPVKRRPVIFKPTREASRKI